MSDTSNVFSEVPSLWILETKKRECCVWVIWYVWYSLLSFSSYHTILEESYLHFFELSFPVCCYPPSFWYFVFLKYGNISISWVKKSQKSAQKSHKNAQTSWVDSIYCSTIYVFARESNLDETFLKVGPSSYWGLLIPSKNDKICSEYGGCAIPFLWMLFLGLGISPSF